MKQTNTIRKQFIYLVLFLALVAVEVLIALFVHDSFVRPYVGDIIVIAVIYCFIRIFIPYRVKMMPCYVFLFATAVEALQYFDYVTLLGLNNNSDTPRDVVFFYRYTLLRSRKHNLFYCGICHS